MSIDYRDLLDRVVALEVEALAAISVTADAVDHFLHVQEAFPYFTNRIGDIEIGDDGSETEDVHTTLVIARLIVGHQTENYVGLTEDSLYQYIGQVITFMNEHENLRTSTTGLTDEMTDLERARVVRCSGFRVFRSAGISTSQVGTEFTIRCDLNETITQEFN